MRLFIAVFPPKAVQDDLLRRLESLPFFHKIPWGAPITYHITLKFIGNTKNTSIFENVLAECGSRHRPFSLRLEGGGGFPSLAKPRVLWAGLTGEVGPLKELASDIEQTCAGLGYPPENRTFSPHLTLARLEGLDAPSQKSFLASLSTYQSASFPVEKIELVESRPAPTGAVYSHLFSSVLAA